MVFYYCYVLFRCQIKYYIFEKIISKSRLLASNISIPLSNIAMIGTCWIDSDSCLVYRMNVAGRNSCASSMKWRWRWKARFSVPMAQPVRTWGWEGHVWLRLWWRTRKAQGHLIAQLPVVWTAQTVMVGVGFSCLRLMSLALYVNFTVWILICVINIYQCPVLNCQN